MIKIEETDALWHYYKRHYQNFAVPPPPQNLCDYFWKAVGGAWKAFFWDTLFLFPLLAFASVCAGLYFWSSSMGVFSTSKVSVAFAFVQIFFAFGIAASGGGALLVLICRWFIYWRDNDVVCLISGCLFFGTFGAVLLSIGFIPNGGSWSWWFLFYGFMIELGAVVAVILIIGIVYLFSGKTNLGKNIRQYFKAIKDRVCPLVEPPQSWQDAERERQLSATDS